MPSVDVCFSTDSKEKWHIPCRNDIPFHKYNVRESCEYLQFIQVFVIGHICTLSSHERSKGKIAS